MTAGEVRNTDMRRLFSLVPARDRVRTKRALEQEEVRAGNFTTCLMHHLSGRQVTDRPTFHRWVRDLASRGSVDAAALDLACRRLVRGFDEASEVMPTLLPGATMEAYQACYPCEYLLGSGRVIAEIDAELGRRGTGKAAHADDRERQGLTMAENKWR